MRQLFFLFKSITLGMFMFTTLTACQKEEQSNQVDFTPQNPVATTYEAKVMQQTTNVIVSMLNENPDLFNDINEAIKSDAVEYMEDRILFADLFRNPQFARSIDGQAKHTTFSSEFKKHATANIQYAPAETRATTLDADALMQYLVDNNVSVYCPFPLEYYAEDNRIPAIAANIGEEYEELPGIQFYADGSYDSVMVSQAYADNHPVWLINPEKDYIFKEYNMRNRVLAVEPQEVIVRPENTWPIGTAHYEISFPSVYITNYMGTLAGGDLNIRICRSSQNPVYSETDHMFMGVFDDITPYDIPRKYVYNAKLGYDKGWYDLQGFVFEQDWKAEEYQHYIAVYEYDNKAVINDTLHTHFQYDSTGIVLSVDAGISISYKSKEDIMAKRLLERAWIFDLANGTANNVGSWTDEDGAKHYTDLAGYNLMRLSGDLLFSVRKRTYYSN